MYLEHMLCSTCLNILPFVFPSNQLHINTTNRTAHTNQWILYSVSVDTLIPYDWFSYHTLCHPTCNGYCMRKVENRRYNKCLVAWDIHVRPYGYSYWEWNSITEIKPSVWPVDDDLKLNIITNDTDILWEHEVRKLFRRRLGRLGVDQRIDFTYNIMSRQT